MAKIQYVVDHLGGRDKQHPIKLDTNEDGEHTVVVFETNEIFTTYIADENKAYREYRKFQESRTADRVIKALITIAGTLVRRYIATMVQEECEACEIQDPSQLHHTCMISWEDKMGLYYDRAFEKLKNESIFGIYVGAVIGEWTSVLIPVEANNLKEAHKAEINRNVDLEIDEFFISECPFYDTTIDSYMQ